MPIEFFGWFGLEDEFVVIARRVVPVVLLATFWCWETWRPFFGQPHGRGMHAVRNLGIALINTVVLGLGFAALTTAIIEWTERHEFGLLHVLDLGRSTEFALSLALLDGWMYLWHRANHAIPLLWRFHRMHHSDPNMDVTTATRFHLGELLVAALARLALIPLLGLHVENVIAYDLLVVGITQFHHADISIGRWDWWLRWLIVTPSMHKVHHSDCQPETDSNYSTVFSWWDRLGRTFRLRVDLRTIRFGLATLADPSPQTWRGMWATPFSKQHDRDSAP